jgi:hypothetical protein
MCKILVVEAAGLVRRRERCGGERLVGKERGLSERKEVVGVRAVRESERCGSQSVARVRALRRREVGRKGERLRERVAKEIGCEG